MKSRINKIKKSIRAISPVISVLLMIAIAVVASLVAYMWMMGYIGGKTTQVGKAVLIQSMANDTSGHLVVYAQNVGQGNVNFDPPNTAYVNSQLQNSAILITTLAPGQTTPINTNYKVASTDPITVKIVTMDGTFAQTTGTPNNGAPNASPIQYQVTFAMSGNASSSTTITPTAGTKSYLAGTQVPITANAVSPDAFSSWTFTGSIIMGNPLSVSSTATTYGTGAITANFIPASASKLVYASGTAPQTLTVGVLSNPVTVQLLDQFNNPVTSGATINLASTSGGGLFYATSAGTTPVTSVTIPSGSALSTSGTGIPSWVLRLSPLLLVPSDQPKQRSG